MQEGLTMYFQSSLITPTPIWVPRNTTNVFASISTPLQTNNLVRSSGVAYNYSQQLNGYLTEFNDLRAIHQRALEQFLQGNGTCDPQTYRNRGVDMAWRYEKADIEMGGNGSANWNKSQRQEILETGKVKGAEGHHLRNVAKYPEDQSDPDNIAFFKSHEKHRIEGHQGDFRNESNAPKKNKNAMLRGTNRKRVIRNELNGAGIAAAISFATAFSISLIVAAAQDGITPESLKNASINGGNAAIMGTAYYAVGRIVGKYITPMIVKTLEDIGVKVTENISTACSMAITGIAVIAIISVVQFVRLKRKGHSTRDALVIVGKTAAISLGEMAICAIVYAIWGGPYAIIVGVVISVALVGYTIYNNINEKKTLKKVRDLTAEILFNRVGRFII